MAIRLVELRGRKVVHRGYHSLRHTFTSIFANAGINEETRMALTGSSDAGIHATYTHHDDDKLKEAVGTLPQL